MKHIVPVLLLLLFPACAAMQQQAIDTYCNPDGAYQKGYNDGHETGRMDNSFVGMCPSDQDSIRHSYRDGFDKGAAQRAVEPQPVQVVVPTPPGGGGDGWECREDYGQKTCGYHCVESYGKVRCAGSPYDTCVAAFGDIKCGRNCREEYGEIKCDDVSGSPSGGSPSGSPSGNPGGPGWECHDHFGQQICGYHCLESFGQMKCAQRPFHNCAASGSTIKCGVRCREEYGEVKCDRYD